MVIDFKDTGSLKVTIAKLEFNEKLSFNELEGRVRDAVNNLGPDNMPEEHKILFLKVDFIQELGMM